MFSPERWKLSPEPRKKNVDAFHKSQKIIIYSNQKEGIESKSTYDFESQVDPCFDMVDPKWKPFPQQSSITEHSIINNFCPFCGKFVSKVVDCFVWTHLKNNVSYFCHSWCRDDFTTFTTYKKQSTFINQKINRPEKPISLGSEEFYLTISIEHPLSRIKYLFMEKKININSDTLFIQFGENEHNSLFSPNLVILPLSQFKIIIQLKSLKNLQAGKEQINFNVDLSPNRHKISTIEAFNENVIFKGEFERILSETEKNNLIHQSNFKFVPSEEGQDLIKFNKFAICLNKQKKSQITLFQPTQQLSRKISIESNEVEDNQINQYQALQYLNYVKTHAGSKQFQKKVKIMSGEEINETVEKLLPYLQEVILNEYANYMFQSLIGACNLQQRIKILTKIGEKISEIVCQQQGTFVFQQFINYLTDEEQFYLICQQIDKDFYCLCLDNYGNHFIRKLIQKLPSNLLTYFSDKVVKFLVEFSQNKNAICVLKSFLRALKNNQKNFQFLKRIILCMSMNTEEIIKNQYGNYLIQEGYEIYGSNVLAGVNETIIRLFPSIGCEKFSASVIQNCIKKYWLYDQSLYEDLRSSLSQKKILNLYRNHYGNRVLLEIMQSCDYLPLKEKVNSAVSHDKSSKFNNNKWVHLRANRWTGAVGTHYSSFTQAVSHKKNHYNNIM